MTEMKREVDSFCELLAKGREHQAAITAESEETELRLRVLKEHLLEMRKKREESRTERLAALKSKHSEVDEEWSQAKSDKARSMTVRKNIEWVHKWLEKQRNMRKVLRLHIGLEEMAKGRFDRLVNKIVTNLGGNDVDQALKNYQNVIARNKSLLQEAEYKLSLQALYERKVAALASELRWVRQMLASASRNEYVQQIDKSEIHFAATVERMKTAEQGFKRAKWVKEGNKMAATKVVIELDTLLVLLSSLDQRNEAAASASVSFHTSLPQAFLMLEKRLLFLLAVTAQRLQTTELIRSLKIEIIRTSDSVESLLKMLKNTPRMREWRHDILSSRLSTSHPNLQTGSDQMSISKESESQPSFTAYRKGRKLKLLRNLKQQTLSRLATPREIFSERMRMYKEFELAKRMYAGQQKDKATASTLEVLFDARQKERRLMVMTQGGPRRKSKDRKSNISDRQRVLLATARSYLSTRSDTYSNGSSNRLK